MKLLDQSAKTNWKFIAIVAFVAVFLAGGILMLIPQFQESTLPSVPSPQPQAINNQPFDNTQGEQSAIDTSGWQTYRSDEFGFEVEYPKNGVVNHLSEGWPFISITLNAGIITFAPREKYPRGYEDPELRFQTANISFADGTAKRTSVVLAEEIVQFFLYDFQGAQAMSWSKDSEILIGINHKETALSNKAKSEIFDQILATFRFVE